MDDGGETATVLDYLAALPPGQRAALGEVRRLLLAAIPGVEEKISYRVPVFLYRGRGLVSLSAATNHCSLHLMSPGLAKELAGEVTEGTMVGATLHFDEEAPLSEATVRLIVERRIAEVDRRLG